MLLETLLNDRQDAVIDEPRHGLLHHALVLAELVSDAKQVQRIERGC
jgi:hypothetical protein